MPPFRTVFFDVGGTLLHMGEPVAAYCDILADYGYPTDPACAAEALGDARRVAAAVPAGALPDGTIIAERESARRDAMVREFLSRIGVERNFEECRRAIWDSWLGTKVFHRFPETLPVLRQLNDKGYRLVAVSNWEPRLEALCANHGLLDFFEFVLASESEGRAKPDPYLFQKALQLTGVAPSEAVHVGDSYAEDIEAARKLGIAAVLIEREGRSGIHSPSIDSLRHLLPLVEAKEWIHGIVTRGSGEATQFTQMDWVCRQMLDRFGFVPYPGTFNLRPESSRDQAAFRRLKESGGILLEAAPGFCAARCFPVTLEGGLAGALVVPEVDGYPDDKLEILAPICLRDRLFIGEGGRVTLAATAMPA